MPRPLRIAALVKQIPKIEAMSLGPDGRLQRDGVELHMNDYCRRAVAKGGELAKASGGSLTVITLGPPSAENVLREAIACGADHGVHITDAAFAGSDTWATDVVPNPDPDLAFIAHHELITKNGVLNHENLNFDELIKDKVSEFVYAPLRIKGATGSPGRPIAIV